MSIPKWLRRRIDAIPVAPADDVSNLDRLDGVRPLGEVAPLSDQQGGRLMASILSPVAIPCHICGWTPRHGFEVLNHIPAVVEGGEPAHYARSIADGETPVYDQEYPGASEVEAWLSGGAR